MSLCVSYIRQYHEYVSFCVCHKACTMSLSLCAIKNARSLSLCAIKQALFLSVFATKHAHSLSVCAIKCTPCLFLCVPWNMHLSLSMHASNRRIHSDQKLCPQVWQTSETVFWPDLALLRRRRQLAGMCSQPFWIERVEWSTDRIQFWGLYSHHLTCHQLNTTGGSVQDKLEPFHCADLPKK